MDTIDFGISASGVMRLRLRRRATVAEATQGSTSASSLDFGFGFEIEDRGHAPTLQVSRLIDDSEAQRSGLLRVGDLILKVNTVEVSACTFDEALQTLASTPAGAYASFLVRAPFGYATRLVTTFGDDGTPSTMRITERASRKLSASPVPSASGQQQSGNQQQGTNNNNNVPLLMESGRLLACGDNLSATTTTTSTSTQRRG